MVSRSFCGSWPPWCYGYRSQARPQKGRSAPSYRLNISGSSRCRRDKARSSDDMSLRSDASALVFYIFFSARDSFRTQRVSQCKQRHKSTVVRSSDCRGGSSQRKRQGHFVNCTLVRPKRRTHAHTETVCLSDSGRSPSIEHVPSAQACS